MSTDSRSDVQHSPQQIAGQRIRAARLRKGWNQSVLAAKAGVSRTTLYQIERGEIAAPHAATVHRLAHALEIPVSLLDAGESADITSTSARTTSSPRGNAEQFDRQTNPFVDVVRTQSPHVFAGFLADDWDELFSSFGTGGALTEEGVLAAVLAISRKRETLRRVSLLLETHLADPTRAMVDSLFQLIQPPAGDGEL